MEENTTIDISAVNEKIAQESAFIDLLKVEMNKAIVGQTHMVERLLIGLLGKGHILLEGVPGLAKTLAINTLAKAVKGSFSRIQFTPDLLPADVVGTLIYNIKENDFWPLPPLPFWRGTAFWIIWIGCHARMRSLYLKAHPILLLASVNSLWRSMGRKTWRR